RNGVNLFHAMVKGADKGPDTRASITLRDSVFIIFPRQMDELNLASAKTRKRSYDGFIYAVCSLTSTHHQNGFHVPIQSENAQRILAIDRGQQTAANWSSSHFQSRSREIPAAFCKSD